MPNLVFKRDGASFEAFFVHTADRIDVMKAWKPSVDDLMFLSRDDLVRLGDGNFQFTSKDVKKDIATCLVRDWDKVISFFGNKSYSYTLPSFGSIGGASSHQEKGHDGYGGDGFGGDGGDEPEDEPSDDGDDDDLQGSDNDEWLELFIKNGTSTKVIEVKGSWLFKSVYYQAAAKWRTSTNAMRFVNVKGDTMIPSITIEQNKVKHHTTLTILFDGVGGASQKRRAISIVDMTVKTTDVDAVKAVFAITSFNSRGWLQTLSKDDTKEYLMEIENRKNLTQQVSSTIERVQEFKALKDRKTQKQNTTFFRKTVQMF